MKDEKRNKRKVPLYAVVMLCVLCLLLGAILSLWGMRRQLGPDGLALMQAHQAIEERFVGEYDQAAYHQKVLRTMVDSLGDRWSYYMTPEEYEQVQKTRENAYVGIGVTVRMAPSGGLEILTVQPDSPAEKAGLQIGEVIRAVEDQEVTETTYEACVDTIQGPEGEPVSLEIAAKDGTIRTVSVVRQKMHTVSAHWTMLDHQVGLITIQNFYVGTAETVRQGIEELTAQHAQALILDVRNNPGGYVTELTEILDTLLPEGKTFVSRELDGTEEVYTSDAACVDLPMAVLVNENSYSAAEFLAAQLKESAGAVIAGTQTSGKGYAQQVFPLEDGSAMGLSTSRYFTGGGVSLIGTGLHPDPEASLSEEQERQLFSGQLPPEEDAPLQAAIRALKLPS